jgi:hypothetical protein
VFNGVHKSVTGGDEDEGKSASIDAQRVKWRSGLPASAQIVSVLPCRSTHLGSMLNHYPYDYDSLHFSPKMASKDPLVWIDCEV